MKNILLFSLLAFAPVSAFACTTDEVVQLVNALKLSPDNMDAQDFKGAGEENWRVLTKKDGTLSSITHVKQYDTRRETNKFAVVDALHFAIKKEIYNYVEPRDNITAPDTSHKDIQTFFYCNDAVHVMGSDKVAYAQTATGLLDEFFNAGVLKDVFVKANIHRPGKG